MKLVPNDPTELTEDVLTIAQYVDMDIAGFNRFISAAKMCGYELVRNGQRLAAQNAPIESTRNLRAYYYGFSPTGNDAIDAVLEMVAAAGKSFHHTCNWSDEQDFLEGKSWINLIQEAANNAAAPPAPKGLEEMLEGVLDGGGWTLHKYSEKGGYGGAKPGHYSFTIGGIGRSGVKGYGPTPTEALEAALREVENG